MAENTQSAVSFQSVSKRFGEVAVLKDFNLELAPGDFVSLIGPSGCGKTTLLRLVAGLTERSSGNLVKSVEAEKLAYIFQDATLLPWRTALRNVMLPLELAGGAKDANQALAKSLLEKVGLGDSLGKFPRQLSGGMKMRVSLARALATEPSLLLLDEPFGALDAMTRNRLNEELLALRDSQAFTALFVTHSVTEAVFLSNRIVVMTPTGQIAAVETVPFDYPRTSELRQQTAFYESVARVTAKLNAVMEGAA